MPQDTHHLKLKRFRPADPERGEQLPPFDLQERDREILLRLYELRLATVDILQHLVPRPELSERHQAALARARHGYQAWLLREQAAGRRRIRGTTAPVKREIEARVYKLFHHGYVRRLKISNNTPIVYHLGPQAVPELVSTYGLDYDKVRRQTREDKLRTDAGDDTGHYFTKHSLMLGRFRVALTQALRHHQATLAFWEPDGAFAERVSFVHETGAWEETTIIPDAHIGLYDGSELHHLFAETERTLKTPARYYRKLYAYKEFFEQGLHKQHQMEHFRVLTVTPTEAMKEVLRAIAARIPTSRGLFWFATEEHYRDSPTHLLAPIWQTAKNNEWRALLEPPKSSYATERRTTTPARELFWGRSAL
jgi:hypothetical protein